MNWTRNLCLCAFAVCVAQAEVRLLTGDANNELFSRDAFIMDISQDGNLILFVSGPPSSGETPPGIEQGGLYIRNLDRDTLTFTGATNTGAEASISNDGRFVAWTSPQNQIFWRDCQTNETRSITPTADGACRRPIISADGRYVAYASVARNLVTDESLLPANQRAAVYLYDSADGSTTVASLSHDGKGLATGVGFQVPQFEFDFSLDGKFIVYSTDAPNAHPSRATAANQAYFWVYRRELASGQVEVASKNGAGNVPRGNFTTPRIDAIGNRILMTGGFVGLGGGELMIPGYSASFGFDFYLKEMSSGQVWWVSKTVDGTIPDGQFASGELSADGSVAAFASSGTKFVSENTDPGGGDSIDIFRVAISAEGVVATTLITKAAVGDGNVGILTGPHLPGNDDYVAFTTGYLYSMLGTGTDNSFFKHGVAVGRFPGMVFEDPILIASLEGDTLVIMWNGGAGFHLEVTPSLSNPNWQPATVPLMQHEDLTKVEIPVGSGEGYFRLRMGVGL